MYKERNEERQRDAEYYASEKGIGYDYNEELCTGITKWDKKKFDDILNEIIKQQEEQSCQTK
jgi:hypothetical protein